LDEEFGEVVMWATRGFTREGTEDTEKKGLEFIYWGDGIGDRKGRSKLLPARATMWCTG
jgi:hypothetical protein